MAVEATLFPRTGYGGRSLIDFELIWDMSGYWFRSYFV
jgi:hypothetical protein